MQVAILGDTPEAEVLARAARDAGAQVSGPGAVAPHDGAVLHDVLTRADVVVIESPPADRYRLAEAAARHGAHVLLAWPPASAIPEAQALVRLAEEAGVEIGVRRPLRRHPAVQALCQSGSAQLMLWQQEVPHGVPHWPRRLADAVDLCSTLAQRSSVRRVEAASVRLGQAWPEATAFSLRFHNGAYAQVNLRRSDADRCQVYVAGNGTPHTADLAGVQAALDALNDGENAGRARALEATAGTLLRDELHAFLQAITNRQPPPVPVLEGLQTLRLIERLQEHLR